MSRLGVPARKRFTAGGGLQAAALLGLALAPMLLALSVAVGIGLHRDVPVPLALVGGLALVVLPALGLASLFGRGAVPLAGCTWLWSLAFLFTFPLYLPGERGRNAHEGMRLLAAPAGAERANRMADWAEEVSRALGGERVRSGQAIRLADAGPGQNANRANESGQASTTAALHTPAEPRAVSVRDEETADDLQTTVLPYAGEGRSLQVMAYFDGPVYGSQFKMIFDTGATFTTLNHESLDALGISIPKNAPVATVHTANGPVRAPLVLVDAVWLGDEVVEWVTIAVCEPCARGPIAGLLGLNVTGQFQVALDHEEHEIRLQRRRNERDRQLDIAQWLALRSTVRRWWDGRVEIEVTGDNRSGAPIREALVEVACRGDRYAVQLLGIPPQGSRTTTASLPRGADCSEYSIKLHSGSWPAGKG